MKVSLLDLKKEYALLENDIQKQLQDCFSSQHWILGEKVVEFEKRAAQYLGAKHAVGVSSGTEALLLSLRALAIKLKNKEFFDKKDEIITTPFTFVATAETIVRSGATPVFVDICPDTFNIDPEKIKKAINKNTIGILPVHLYGLACAMDEIKRIAKEHKLFIVEDTAQAFGARYKNEKAGTIGDLGAFSFFPSKNLGGWGDGGLIATNDQALFDLIKVLRDHGQVSRYDAKYIGYNARLDSIQAAILLAKLKYIEKFNSLRRRVANKYNKYLGKIRELTVPLESDNYYHVYHQYSVKVSKKRDELLKLLNSKGIESRVYYPVPLHKMEAFKRAKVGGPLKNTMDIISRILSLPIHPFLKDAEIKYVIDNIYDFF